MSKCVIYARVSTKEQEAEGYSLDAQLKACRTFCSEQGLTPVAEFIEAESAAGKAKRQEFAKLLEFLAENEDVDVVVAHKLDRLYRNFKDPILLEEAGATPRYVIGDAPATPQGQLSNNVQLAVSKFYSDNLSQEVRKGMDEKVAQGGFPHWAPVGYLNDKNTRSLVVDFEKAPLIRHAFERYATGTISLRALASELFEKGLRSRQGARVSPSALQNILKNPIYAGMLRYKGEVHPGIHDPIVSTDLFQAAQEPFEPRRRGKAARTKHTYALRDWLYCSECGCKITVEHQRGHNYYRCTHGKGREACSQRTYTREEKLFAQVDEILSTIEFSPELIEVLVEESKAIDAREAKSGTSDRSRLQDELERNREKSSRLLDGYLEGVVPVTDYSLKSEQLELKRATIERQLEQASEHFIAKTPQVEALALAGAAARYEFRDADTTGKRRVLDTVLLNADVQDGEIKSYQLKDPFGVLETDSAGVPVHSWWAIQDLNL